MSAKNERRSPSPPENKNEVRRAGQAIFNGTATAEDYDLVDRWRAAHGYALNTFQIWIRRAIETKKVRAQFAQRLKRHSTTIDKLKRKTPEGAPLISDVTTMHDFAGCRIIFDNIEDLQNFRDFMRSKDHLKNVKHEFKNHLGKYDYIEKPKKTGYRGIHDIVKHIPRPHRKGSDESAPWRGLLAEIQYRTRVQHSWATALEISDLIDRERTKFGFGNDERGKFFSLASEILSREKEDIHHAYPETNTRDLVKSLKEIESRLRILERLRSLKAAPLDESRFGEHNVLIIEQVDGDPVLKIERFTNRDLAIERASALEKGNAQVNAVYVTAKNKSQIRFAFQNYFNDPVDFVKTVGECIAKYD